MCLHPRSGTRLTPAPVPSASEQPLTLLQFVLYLYHHCAEMRPVLMSTEALTVLAGTLFPYRAGAESSPTTPLDDAVSGGGGGGL